VLDAAKLGGQLGGLTKYETEKLVPLQKDIADIARQIASKVNTQLASGFKPGGAAGTPLFVYTPGSNADMLKLSPGFVADDLAFSGDGTPGDTGNLQKLVAIKSQPITVGTLGNVLLSDADTQIVGKLGVDSQLNKAALKTTQTVRTQSVDDWQSTSGVNQDEEAVNLVEYQNMYQANMKVIAIANQLFDATLAMMG
jgi:flagellar hook-associated protein 1 FlgK